MSRLLDALTSAQPLLMDGAMGTELFRRGAPRDAVLEEWNLTRPDTVLSIHRAYVEAGATVLLSNTFQAFPARLAKFGLREKTRAIIHAGVALARRAAGAAVLVLGSLGPLTASDEELDDVLDAFQASTGPDDSRGVDGLLLETLSDTSLLERVRPRLSRDVPLLFAATYRVGAAGPVTFEGLTPREVARRAAEAGADAVGFNCGKDIDARALGRIFEQYRAATALPLFARPNAGTPREESGRLVFPVDAETFARNLAPLRGKLAMVGGCCGTTPEYIRSLAACLRA